MESKRLKYLWHRTGPVLYLAGTLAAIAATGAHLLDAGEPRWILTANAIAFVSVVFAQAVKAFLEGGTVEVIGGVEFVFGVPDPPDRSFIERLHSDWIHHRRPIADEEAIDLWQFLELDVEGVYVTRTRPILAGVEAALAWPDTGGIEIAVDDLRDGRTYKIELDKILSHVTGRELPDDYE